MPPTAWGGDAVISMVNVDALADGLCLAAAKAPVGEDYLFCGEPLSIRALFEIWSGYPGGMMPRLWLQRWLIRWQVAMLESFQRALGCPAFLSRDTVDASRAHLNYSAAKAQRDLGWNHPDINEMWGHIVRQEARAEGAAAWLREQATPPAHSACILAMIRFAAPRGRANDMTTSSQKRTWQLQS